MGPSPRETTHHFDPPPEFRRSILIPLRPEQPPNRRLPAFPFVSTQYPKRVPGDPGRRKSASESTQFSGCRICPADSQHTLTASKQKCLPGKTGSENIVSFY